MRTLVTVGAALVLGAVIFGGAASAQPQSPGAWPGCCGASAWPNRGGMTGAGHMGPGAGAGGSMMGGRMMGGSAARNHAVMAGGVPAPYANLSNPSPRTAATIERGAKVYAANCASCHGSAGHGDGPAASNLKPPPADLAWLSRMPMSRWDPFMFWTISEGGAPFGSAMPSFKASLAEADRWAVIGYIQAHLPQSAAAR